MNNRRFSFTTLELMDATYGTPVSALDEWAASLIQALASNTHGLNAFADRLLRQSDASRKQDSERKRKSRVNVRRIPPDSTGHVTVEPVNTPKKTKAVRTKAGPSPMAQELATFFMDKYLSVWAPSAKRDAPRLAREAVFADALLRLDGRSPDACNELLDALDSQKPGGGGFLWRNQTLSLGKLRQRWNTGSFEEVLTTYRKMRR